MVSFALVLVAGSRWGFAALRTFGLDLGITMESMVFFGGLAISLVATARALFQLRRAGL